MVVTETGAVIGFSLLVANGGNQHATGVVVTDAIPVGFTVTAGSISDGGVWDAATRTIRWGAPLDDTGTAADPFRAGQSHLMTYSVIVDDPRLPAIISSSTGRMCKMTAPTASTRPTLMMAT